MKLMNEDENTLIVFLEKLILILIEVEGNITLKFHILEILELRTNRQTDRPMDLWVIFGLRRNLTLFLIIKTIIYN